MSKKVIVIIQARMGSTRLPGKVLMNIKNKTVLSHVVDRVKQCKKVDDVIVATTTLSKDDVIVEELDKIGCNYYRGSEDDVLDRYYNAGKLYKGDVIIRITSDCPLIDPNIVDDMIEYYMTHDYDMVTNAGVNMDNRTYPRGLDTEIFSFRMLEKAWLMANQDYQREHVTLYIYENEANIYYYKNKINLSQYRITVDTKEDFQLIESIYNKLYDGKHNFYLEDIMNLLLENPQLVEINKDINQKEIYKTKE